ncbi:MAG: hypothetical protein JXA28_06510 [Bacteroidetes bacterium]|nr:hypothetical protein [Bacteroidota bacterium]
MNPETLASLQALEKELERLRSAVEHIDQAKAVSQKVVAAVALIQKKYGEHLDALLALQQETVDRLGDGTKERFEEISGSARRHILESAARAKKYLEDYNSQVRQALDSTGDIAGRHVEEISSHASDVIREAGKQIEALTGTSDEMLSRFRSETEEQIRQSGARIESSVGKLLEQLQRDFDALNESAAQSVRQAGDSATQHVADITAKAHTSLESMDETARRKIEEMGTRANNALEKLDTHIRRQIEEVGTLAQTGLKEVTQQARLSVEDAGNQSKRIFAAIKKTQDQQVTEFEKVTVSADALIAASGKLVRTIDGVDFPTRLQSIESDIRSLHYNLNTAMSRIDGLEKSNENAMAAFSVETVNKLGRLEAFTDKTVRTLSDSVEKRFTEQEKTFGSTRLIVVLLLVLNILMAVGIYLLWSGGSESEAVPQPVVTDTTAVQTTVPENQVR